MKRVAYLLIAAAFLVGPLSAGCTRTHDLADETGEEELGPGPDDASSQADSGPGTEEDGATIDQTEDQQDPVEDLIPVEGCREGGALVADLQKKEEGLNCVEPAEGEYGFLNLDQGVELNCVVVTAPVHPVTEKVDGFFVADPAGGAYSGIKVVMDKGSAPAVKVGEVLEMVGDLKEYYCLTEFDPITVKTVASGTVPVPAAVGVADLVKGGDAEQWEGVLVRVTNVKVAAHDKFGGFSLEGGLTVDDAIFGDLAPLDPGCRYESIVGVVDYGYGAYRLLPRSAADLVPSLAPCEEPSGDTIKAIQTSEQSLACTGEAFVNVGDVSLTGVIVASPRFVVSKDKLHGFFVSDGLGGPNSGLLLATKFADNFEFEIGDVIDVEGGWTEYYCLTEVNATTVTKTGGDGADKLAVEMVTGADLAPDKAEPWEGVVVGLTDVTVKGEKDNYGQFLVTTGSGNDVMVKLKFEGVTYVPVVGDLLAKVVGPLTYDYEEYKIMATEIVKGQ